MAFHKKTSKPLIFWRFLPSTPKNATLAWDRRAVWACDYLTCDSLTLRFSDATGFLSWGLPTKQSKVWSWTQGSDRGWASRPFWACDSLALRISDATGLHFFAIFWRDWVSFWGWLPTKQCKAWQRAQKFDRGWASRPFLVLRFSDVRLSDAAIFWRCDFLTQLGFFPGFFRLSNLKFGNGQRMSLKAFLGPATLWRASLWRCDFLTQLVFFLGVPD